MKPSFPFNLFRFDLAIVPAHDKGKVPPKALRMILTPSQTASETMRKAGENLKPALRDPDRIKFAIFLGGSTRDFILDLDRQNGFFRNSHWQTAGSGIIS